MENNPYFYRSNPDLVKQSVYELFGYYNEFFFMGALERCSVRWTNRMTQCAGTCTYQGQGSSTIALSEPILKYRNSNEIKATLLHQMVHAYLFITNPESFKIQGGHGPQFQTMIKEINNISGLNISVYHTFYDEVDFYKTHAWRCNGPCRNNQPQFGYIRRSINRKPQPTEKWFSEHSKRCGGQFVKINQTNPSPEPIMNQSNDSIQSPEQKRSKNSKHKGVRKTFKSLGDFNNTSRGDTIQRDEMSRSRDKLRRGLIRSQMHPIKVATEPTKQSKRTIQELKQ